ncbi:MAG: FAD-binding oxidoreductase [Candidatus Thorarchaeota archaeon]
MENAVQDLEQAKDISELSWISSSVTERLSASGDTTGIPYYHYRWKKKWLADYVAWPTSEEEVSAILKYAFKHRIPVVPRGGGTCYFGSGSPTRGGIIIDTKRLAEIIEVNPEEEWVHVQAGSVWEVTDRKLAKHGYALRVWPQSGIASTLAGWLAIGGKAGIGTPKYGSMLDNLVELTVIRPNGELETISGEDMKIFFGTAGIAGLVTSMKLKIRLIPEATDGLMAGFNSVSESLAAVKTLAESEAKPFYLRLADPEYEWRIQGGLPANIKGKYYIVVTYEGSTSEVENALVEAQNIVDEGNGEILPKKFYDRSWEDRFIVEMKLKLEVPTLSMQNYWIDVDDAVPVVEKMYDIGRRYRINSCFYLVLGHDNLVRLCVFAPSDHRHWMHFMSGKSMLHRLTKLSYKQGGVLYTLGLQNTVYLKKFEPELYQSFQEIRSHWDPYDIMNPDKLTHSNMTYLRMNIMFTLNGYLRRLQAIFRIARRILEVPARKMEEKKQ